MDLGSSFSMMLRRGRGEALPGPALRLTSVPQLWARLWNTYDEIIAPRKQARADNIVKPTRRARVDGIANCMQPQRPLDNRGGNPRRVGPEPGGLRRLSQPVFGP